MKILTLFLLSMATISFSQNVTGFENITDTDGNTHSLSSYLENDKYILLNFYLETCNNCMATAPLVESIYQNYGQNQCQIIVLSFIIDNQAPYPSNQDCDNWAINNGIPGPPNFNYTEADWYQFYTNFGGGFAQTYLISPDQGDIIYSHAGGILNSDELEIILNDLSEEINATIEQEENTLEVVCQNNNANYIYEWNTGQSSQQITPSENGNYWVVISDQNNCFSDTLYYYFQGNNITQTWKCNDYYTCEEVNDGSGAFSSFEDCEASCNVTSIDESNMSLKIFPNPSTTIFNLNFNIESQVNITVTNILGKQVFEEIIYAVGEHNVKIDLSEFSKGIYNLKVKSSDGTSTHTLFLF